MPRHEGSLSRQALREAGLSSIRWVAIARVAGEAAAFAATVALARLIPPSEFGIAAIALIVRELALGILFQSVGTLLVQRTSVTRAHVESATLLSFVASAGLAALVAAFALLAGRPLFGERTAELILLMAATFLLVAPGAVPQALMQRDLRFRRLSWIEVGAYTGGAVAAVALAVAGLDAEALLLGALVTLALSTLLFVVSVPIALPRWHRGEAREIARFGLPAVGSALLSVGNRNVDYAIIGARLNATDLGFYYRGYQLGVQYQQKISGVLLRVVFPLYSRSEGRAHLRALRRRVTRVHAAIIWPLLALLIVLAPELVPWLFGERWEPAVAPAQILAVAGMQNAVAAGTGPLLLAAGRPRALLRWNLVLFAAFSTAVFLAAPHGLTAVCLAFVGINQAALLGNYWIVLRRVMNVPPRNLLEDIAPAGVSAAAELAVGFAAVQAAQAAGAPTAVLLPAVGAVALGAYLLMLRLAFPREWSDLLLLGTRLTRRGQAAAVEPAAPPTGPGSPM